MIERFETSLSHLQLNKVTCVRFYSDDYSREKCIINQQSYDI